MTTTWKVITDNDFWTRMYFKIQLVFWLASFLGSTLQQMTKDGSTMLISEL